MARVTVEDCLKNVDNRFDLVIKAAERAHLLELGAADPTVPPDNDKPTVIALREIAAGHDITKTRLSENDDEQGMDTEVAEARAALDEKLKSQQADQVAVAESMSTPKGEDSSSET